MNNFTLLDIEGTINDERKSRVRNVAVKITWVCRLALEEDEMFARYVISLNKFKLEEQLCFTTKGNVMHTQILKDGLNELVKHVEDNNLNQSIK